MQSRTQIDIGVAVACIAIGAVFALEAWRIDPRSSEAIGPRFVPLVLAGIMIVGGALVGGLAWLRDGSAAPPSGDFGFRDSDIRRITMVVAAGALYTFAFWAIGYLGATVLGMALALWVFGVRNPLVLVALSIVAGIMYQFIFMGLMGLLDPRGELLDLRWLSEPVTPQ